MLVMAVFRSSAYLLLCLLIFTCTASNDDVSLEFDESVECHHNNHTYKGGEHIPTPETVCLHCVCREGWGSPDRGACAIVDCPFGYYHSRPNCKIEYVDGECCPILKCEPMNPIMERAMFASKKPRTSTDHMTITTSPLRDVTFYCVADDVTDVNPDLVEWTYIPEDGKEVPVEYGPKVVKGYFPPNTWALYLDETRPQDEGEYVCNLKSDPPRQYKTQLKFHIPKSYNHPSCNGSTKITLPPGKHECPLFPSGYYYDTAYHSCKPYEIKPCQKPENYFATKRECWGMCTNACYSEKDVGSCNVRSTRYYYDHVSDQCHSFVYGGCSGNRNNFRSQEECEDACANLKFRIQGEARTFNDRAQPPCDDSSSCKWRSWLHYLAMGCEAVTEEGSCCPIYFKCPEDVNEINIETSKGGVTIGTYHCDEAWADNLKVDTGCSNCSCHDGKFVCEVTSHCVNSTFEGKLKKGCLPIYENDDCCPKSWHCPPKSKYRQKGPQEHIKEKKELRCKFAGRDYRRGYELITSDPCLTCTCLTPPHFTCNRERCPPHPSTLNATLRCSTKVKHGQHCCNEYDCWDILDDSNRIGRPQTPREFKACKENPCGSFQICFVNFTACYLGECIPFCEVCATPMCSSHSYLEELPYDCPVCRSHTTPEAACADDDLCPDGWECVVLDEERCRQGQCETACEINNTTMIIVRNDTDHDHCEPYHGCPEGCDSVKVEGCSKCKCPIAEPVLSDPVDLRDTKRVPCASVACASPCKPEPAGEDGCSSSCICPKTPEEACEGYRCPPGAQCRADCNEFKCIPECLMCPLVLCAENCKISKDEYGCETCNC